MRIVIQDFVASAAGAVIGLAAILLWPERQTVDQFLVLLVATTAWLIALTAVERLAFGRWPRVWRPRRPYRHSIPNFLGLFAAVIWTSWMTNSASGDWAIAAYVIAIPVLIAGSIVSEVSWAREVAATGS